MNWIDGSIILIALVIMVVVGWLAGRGETKTARGYFLASDRLPWYAIGASWVATSVSSEQIVGTVGMAYMVGMGIANWEWFSWPVLTLLLVFFIPIYLKTRITTIPDFLNRRYGPFCRDFYSFIMLVAYIFIFLPTIIYSGTLAFSALTGINFYLILAAIVLLVGSYTIKGGLAAVVWTDLAQCIMLVGGGVLLFFLALHHIPGGWATMAHANPNRFHLIKPWNDPYAPFLGILAGSVGVFLFYNSSNQVMVQRVLGARTQWDGLMGIIFSGFINLLRPLVDVFLGFVVFYYIIHHGGVLIRPDLAFTFAVKHFATKGLRGIVMAGLLAAVMGAASSTTNSASTIFTLDIYSRFIHRHASELRRVSVGQVASAVVLLIAAIWCPLIGRTTIFTYFQTGVTYLATPFIAVILLGILWRRPNALAGSIGLVGGVIIQVIVVVGSRWLVTMGYLSREVHWLYLAFIAEVLTLLLIAGMSLIGTPAPNEQVESLVWTPSVLRSMTEARPRPWWQSLLLWYFIFSVIWFSLYIHFR